MLPDMILYQIRLNTYYIVRGVEGVVRVVRVVCVVRVGRLGDGRWEIEY